MCQDVPCQCFFSKTFFRTIGETPKRTGSFTFLIETSNKSLYLWANPPKKTLNVGFRMGCSRVVNTAEWLWEWTKIWMRLCGTQKFQKNQLYQFVPTILGRRASVHRVEWDVQNWLGRITYLFSDKTGTTIVTHLLLIPVVDQHSLLWVASVWHKMLWSSASSGAALTHCVTTSISLFEKTNRILSKPQSKHSVITDRFIEPTTMDSTYCRFPHMTFRFIEWGSTSQGMCTSGTEPKTLRVWKTCSKRRNRVAARRLPASNPDFANRKIWFRRWWQV